MESITSKRKIIVGSFIEAIAGERKNLIAFEKKVESTNTAMLSSITFARLPTFSSFIANSFLRNVPG